MKHIKVILVRVLLGVVIVGLAGTATWYFLNSKQQNSAGQVQTDAEKTVEELNQTGDTQELNNAKSKLEKLAEDEKDPQKRITYLSGAMDAAAAAGDYDSALKFAKEIDEQEKTALSAATYAGYADIAGDYEEAVEYFGIAAERSSGQPKRDYEMMRDNAQAKNNES